MASCVGGPSPERAAAPPPLRMAAEPPIPSAPPQPCDTAGGAEEATLSNRASLETLPWAGFGRAESGWAVYAPATAAEIASRCAAGTPGFARALRRWEQAQGLTATGAMGPAVLNRLKTLWQGRRPFVALRARDICPAPPADGALDVASPSEGLDGKPVQLRRDAFVAYRRMVGAAHREVAELRADPRLLTLFSGYRSPAYDAARCARDNNCQGIVRAACSAHRTGLAMDVDVGTAPGYAVDSSADANRLAQVRGPTYRWLLANARRFGFVNYAFEPWHWEWIGAAA